MVVKSLSKTLVLNAIMTCLLVTVIHTECGPIFELYQFDFSPYLNVFSHSPTNLSVFTIDVNV